MAKTSREAWRHYGAVMDFFGAIEDVVSGEAWKEFVRLQKDRKNIQQSFRRLVVRGFIKRRGTGWGITKEGLRWFKRLMRPRASVKNAPWDGKWRLVSFDVPIESNVDRDSLRRLLIEFDFVPLQKSVWASPFATAGELVELMAERDLWKYCKLMVVDILEGDEDLRKLFKLSIRGGK